VSNQHITAVRKCNQFRSNTRLLLFILADAASNGKQTTETGIVNLPYGYTSKGERQLMKDMNTARRQTITDAMDELAEAGAIVRARRMRKNALTFVDITWLQEHSESFETEATDNVATESSTQITGVKAHHLRANDALMTNSVPTPDQLHVEPPVFAAKAEAVCSTSRSSANSAVHNGKRGNSHTKNVASVLPRKTLADHTENVATSTPVFDRVVVLPAPQSGGILTRSQVREDGDLASLIGSKTKTQTNPAQPEPTNGNRPVATENVASKKPNFDHPFKGYGKSLVCKKCGLTQQEYFCSGYSTNPANVCPALPCERNIMCPDCGLERDEMGHCFPCIEKKREERRKAKAEKVTAQPVPTVEIAKMLGAEKAVEVGDVSDL